MAQIQLININSNNYFDKNLKTISLFDTKTLKEAFLNDLFEDIISFDIYSNQNTDSGIMVVLEGNFRFYTYAKLLEKYYFVTNVKTIFEKGIEKTQIYLEYDLINNSNLTINDLKRNSLNNNFFLYRTTLGHIKPTYHNLLRCSNVCENIMSEIEIPEERIYQLTNNYDKITKWGPENIGQPVFYIKFKSNKLPKRNLQSFEYLINELTDKFGGKVTKPIFKQYFQQMGSYINNEYTDFVTIFPVAIDKISLNMYYQKLDEILESADFIEYIAFDYIDSLAIVSSPLIDVFINMTPYGEFNFLKILDNRNISNGEYNLWGRLSYFDSIKNWENKYNFTHFIYAHTVPYFFSQRWSKKKIILPYFAYYRLEQFAGVDNTFINIFGRDKYGLYFEHFDNEKMCNMQSTRIGLTSNLTDHEKLYNDVLNNSLGSIGSIIGTVFAGIGGIAGGFMGGPMGAAAGAAAGSAIGGALGTYARGAISNQWKQREKGLLTIASTDNYKKYLNFHIRPEPNLPERYSIDIYKSFLNTQQEEVITKDRQKYGNYINDYIEITLKDIVGVFYLEGNWITFNKGIQDILLQDKIIEIFNRGVFIHFNPDSVAKKFKFISSNNDFIFKTPDVKIKEDDEIIFTSDESDVEYLPKEFTFLDDEIKIKSTKWDIFSNVPEKVKIDIDTSDIQTSNFYKYIRNINNFNELINFSVTSDKPDSVVVSIKETKLLIRVIKKGNYDALITLKADNAFDAFIQAVESDPDPDPEPEPDPDPEPIIKKYLNDLNITTLNYFKKSEKVPVKEKFLQEAIKQEGFENLRIFDFNWAASKDIIFGDKYIKGAVTVTAKSESKNFDGYKTFDLYVWD